jgi:hypothetical protein
MMTHDIAKHPCWTRDEFLAFLLLYCADADMECSEAERKMIRDHIDEARLTAIEEEYARLTDFERITVIKTYQSWYFDSGDHKAGLLKTVEELFTVDGEYDIMEHNLYRMLQKIL